jgi:phosphatidylserine decarboxylase
MPGIYTLVSVFSWYNGFMETFVLFSLFVSLFFSQWFFRSFWFHRETIERDEIDRMHANIICSPVDGVVVYKKRVSNGFADSVKLGAPVREPWVNGESGTLLGIYMSVFDRHFVVAPASGTSKVLHFKTDKNYPMMDLLEYLRFYAGAYTSKRMAKNAERYVDNNERLHISWGNGIEMLVIGDSNVNKIIKESGLGDGKTAWSRGDKILFIRRGSQCDIFIPDQVGNVFKSVTIGKKLKVGWPIGSMGGSGV